MKANIHTIIYFLAMGGIAATMTLSVWVCNLAWVLLLANWLVEWIFTDKESRSVILSRFKEDRLLQTFVLLFLMMVIYMLWSSNWNYGLDHIRKCFPLLAVPMVLLTSRPHSDKRMLNGVLFCYVMGILAACIVGAVRLCTIPDLPHRDIIPFLSHIRFALNLCLAISLLLWQAWQTGRKRWWFSLPCILLTLIFLGYLFLLQSYTGFIILMVLAIVTVFVNWKRIESRKVKITIAASLSLLMIAIVSIFAYYISDYYRLSPLSSKPLEQTTINGNPYHHKNDGLLESGNYINHYICEIEMEQQWPLVSSIDLDSITPNGYSVRPTLIRYLNAKGLTKDSVGISNLTAEDITAIEKGIANPIYLKKIGLKRMFAVMLYEYEMYRCYHAVVDFTMLQRFELWKNGWKVFLQHPLFGTGTGDVVDECHSQLKKDQSPLAGTTKHTHCQYLTYLITFGILGFILIVWMFVRSIRRNRACQYFPFLATLTIFLISCISEDTLETLAGIIFCVFMLSLFYIHTPKQQ